MFKFIKKYFSKRSFLKEYKEQFDETGKFSFNAKMDNVRKRYPEGTRNVSMLNGEHNKLESYFSSKLKIDKEELTSQIEIRTFFNFGDGENITLELIPKNKETEKFCWDFFEALHK